MQALPYAKFLKKLRLVLRKYAYFIMLGLVVLALFLTNYTLNTVVSADKTVFAFLQKSAFLTPFPVLTFITPLFAMFIGGLGVMVLLEHIVLHEKKRLMAFIGGIAYILNPLTLSIIHEPYNPALWFVALLPWLLWTFFNVLCDTAHSAGQRLFLFSLANIAIAPAFTDKLFFAVYIIFLSVTIFGLVFSPYFFRAVWRSPWLVLLVLLLQLPWLGPFMLGLYDNPTWEAFQIARTVAPPVLWQWNLIPFYIMALFGLIRFQRYYFVFLFLAATLSILWLPLHPVVLQYVKPYAYYFFIPLAVILAYYTAAGLSTVCLIIEAVASFYHKKRPKHESVWHTLQGKTPYEVYQEIVHFTHHEHADKKFTTLQFTEYFLSHILEQAHSHHSKRSKQRTLIPRITAYLAFTLIFVTAFMSFRGGLFHSEYLVSVSPVMAEVMQDMRSLKNSRVAYFPAEEGPSLELRTGIERENDRIVRAVVEKYFLSHLIVDASHLLPSQLTFLKQLPFMIVQKQADNVLLFTVSQNQLGYSSFLSAQNLPNVGPQSTTITDDIAYRNHGMYMTNDVLPYTAYYPFLGLTNSQLAVGEKTTTLNTPLGEDLMKQLDRYELESGTESADLTLTGDTGQTISIPFTLYPELIGNRFILTMNNHRVRYFKPKESADKSVFLETQALEHKYGYVLQVLNNKEPSRIFNVEAYDVNRIYQYVDTSVVNASPIILKPADENGKGYTFGITPERFDNLTMYYLPYHDILGTRFVKNSELTKRAQINQPPIFTQLANGLYQLQTNNSNPQSETIIFMEPYSKGWKLYQRDPEKANTPVEAFFSRWLPFLYGKEYGTHVAINNWANGWVMNGPVLDNSLILVDVPRYVSYAGWLAAGLVVSSFGLWWFLGWYRKLE